MAESSLPRCCMQGAAAQVATAPVGLRLLAATDGRSLGAALPQRAVHTSPQLAAWERKEEWHPGWTPEWERRGQSGADGSGMRVPSPNGASAEQLFRAWLEELRRQGAEVAEQEDGEVSIQSRVGERLRLRVVSKSAMGPVGVLVFASGFLWGTFYLADGLAGMYGVAALVAFYSYIMLLASVRARRD